MVISGTPSRFTVASSCRISSVSPLADKRQHYIAAYHHSKIAVHGFGGMEEQCGATG